MDRPKWTALTLGFGRWVLGGEVCPHLAAGRSNVLPCPLRFEILFNIDAWNPRGGETAKRLLRQECMQPARPVQTAHESGGTQDLPPSSGTTRAHPPMSLAVGPLGSGFTVYYGGLLCMVYGNISNRVWFTMGGYYTRFIYGLLCIVYGVGLRD